MTAPSSSPELALPQPLVVTFANLKGGVGKTTSAFFLAVFFATVLKKRVAYVDADPLSQTGYAWHRRLTNAGAKIPFKMMAFPSTHLVDFIADNRDDYDVFMLDIGGESAKIFEAAVPETDELVMLTSVAPSEVRRIASTWRAAEHAIADKQADEPGWQKKINVRVLMTKVPVTMKNGVNVSTEYREKRAELEEAGFDVFDSYLRLWKWYREAADGLPGKGAENPLLDLGEYLDVGMELVAPYRIDTNEKVGA